MPMDNKAFVVLKKRPVNAKRRQEVKKDDILQRITNKEPENCMQKVQFLLTFIAFKIQVKLVQNQRDSYFWCIKLILLLSLNCFGFLKYAVLAKVSVLTWSCLFTKGKSLKDLNDLKDLTCHRTAKILNTTYQTYKMSYCVYLPFLFWMSNEVQV